MSTRENLIAEWVKSHLGQEKLEIAALAGDASFRRYFRIQDPDTSRSWIVMDAPPEKESLQEFIKVQEALDKHRILSPHIHAKDESLGLLLLDDLGDTLLLQVLTAENADSYYPEALDTICALQTLPCGDLPAFDQAFMHKEMQLFNDWFIQAYLQLKLSPSEEQLLKDTKAWLAEQISTQPSVFIHRDYHSRNLMVTEKGLAVIDFQDAMCGPAAYDAVSLLKDCYVRWPRAKVLEWLRHFHHQNAGVQGLSFEEMVRAFDFCGLQRHLKVLGIFCRLYLRDHKPGYLKDLPLTLHYALDCCESYPELQAFYDFLTLRIKLP